MRHGREGSYRCDRTFECVVRSRHSSQGKNPELAVGEVKDGLKEGRESVFLNGIGSRQDCSTFNCGGDILNVSWQSLSIGKHMRHTQAHEEPRKESTQPYTGIEANRFQEKVSTQQWISGSWECQNASTKPVPASKPTICKEWLVRSSTSQAQANLETRPFARNVQRQGQSSSPPPKPKQRGTKPSQHAIKNSAAAGLDLVTITGTQATRYHKHRSTSFENGAAAEAILAASTKTKATGKQCSGQALVWDKVSERNVLWAVSVLKH
ncbi:hypothetical protein ARMSODRAFT_981559 [Armillaria solidipes]|uniref:Uncharacterized protein n=1 Tax=Armillaria solidipes TaxID=1076256 RepID=A0A2H3B5X5_9AGAR|nr:hypothetical protein ARMSODRAFT_981559 [Armillaria solidipes]